MRRGDTEAMQKSGGIFAVAGELANDQSEEIRLSHDMHRIRCEQTLIQTSKFYIFLITF